MDKGEDKIIYVGMCADIIHNGHINILKEGAKYGKVIVGLLSDNAMVSYKRKPILSYNTRYEVISSIKYVDKVIEQKTLDYSDNLYTLKPDIVIHGDDWKTGIQSKNRQNVINCLSEWNGKLIEIPYTSNISTTLIIKKICNQFEISHIN